MTLGQQFRAYYGATKKQGTPIGGVFGSRLEGAKGYRAYTRENRHDGAGLLWKTTLGIPTKVVGRADWQRQDGVINDLTVEPGHEGAVFPWLKKMNSIDNYGPTMSRRGKGQVEDFLQGKYSTDGK